MNQGIKNIIQDLKDIEKEPNPKMRTPRSPEKDKKKKDNSGANMGLRVDKIEKFLTDAFTWLDPGSIPILQ